MTFIYRVQVQLIDGTSAPGTKSNSAEVIRQRVARAPTAKLKELRG